MFHVDELIKSNVANLENLIRRRFDSSVARQNDFLPSAADLNGESDCLSACDAGGTTRNILHRDLEIGNVGIFNIFQGHQGVLAIPGEFEPFTIKSNVVGITPSRASSGALALVAIPSSVLARARFTIRLEAAPWRVNLSSVLALTLFDEHAFSFRVTDVVVSAFAPWFTII